jgi:hypothetical protein
VPIDEPFTFTVKVCGAESTCALSAAPAPESSEGVGSSQGGGPAQIKVGGQVIANLSTDMPGQVSANSGDRQPIITSADEAEWEWQLQPSQAGQFPLTVRFSVLRQDSDEALLPDQKYVVPLTVRSTAEHTARSAWLGLKEFIGLLSAAGVSCDHARRTRTRQRRSRRRRVTSPRTTAVVGASFALLPYRKRQRSVIAAVAPALPSRRSQLCFLRGSRAKHRRRSSRISGSVTTSDRDPM